MLLLAEGLFRLDIAIAGDTVRTVVRNLSSGQLEMQGGAGRETGASIAFGDDIAAYEPHRAFVEFALGTGADRVAVEVTIGTLRFARRGTIRVSARAILRHAPPA